MVVAVNIYTKYSAIENFFYFYAVNSNHTSFRLSMLSRKFGKLLLEIKPCDCEMLVWNAANPRRKCQSQSFLLTTIHQFHKLPSITEMTWGTPLIFKYQTKILITFSVHEYLLPIYSPLQCVLSIVRLSSSSCITIWKTNLGMP